MLKVLLGGLIGGLVAFGWGAVSHLVLDIGGMGIEQLPRETAVMESLSEKISEPGLYVFPGVPAGVKLSEKQQADHEERYRKGPTGFLVYHPRGRASAGAEQMGIQVASDVLAAFLAAVLLSMMTRVGYLRRVLFVTLLGVFAWATVDLPQWNMYRFPDDFTLGRLLDHLGRWFTAGVVMAGIVSGKPK